MQNEGAAGCGALQAGAQQGGGGVPGSRDQRHSAAQSAEATGKPQRETGEPAQATVYIGYTGNPIYDVLGEGSQAICAVQASDNYPLLGRNFDTTWVFIEAQCTDGTTVQGWMNANNVAIRNTGNVFVPIFNSDGTPR